MERIKQYEPLWDAWEIKRKIGEGSFGAVYEVETSLYDVTRRAAVKLITFRNTDMLNGIPVEETLSEDAMKKIKEEEAKKNVREVSLMNILQGSNHIVTIHEFKIIPGESTTDVLILMELLTSVSHYVRNGEADREFVIKLGIDICKALESCEREKIIHRDIKPDNIFVNKEGDFKLGDFGLSRKMSQSASESLRKFKGTPLYMSPEACAWGRQVDHTSDLYSLGIVMYQLLNEGKIPFGTIKEDYDDEERAIRQRLDGKEILPPVHEKGNLWKIIQKAIRFKKEDRYQSAGLMRKDLEELLQKQEGMEKQKSKEEQNSFENDYYDEKENDGEKAVQRFGKAAEQGDTEAQFHLGNCYYDGEGVAKDYEKAVEWYKIAAVKGHAKAQNKLGNCYYYGKGIKRDWKKAAEWYERAAKQGCVEAQRNLGALYYNGEGVEKNLEKALYWYEKAGSKNFVKEIREKLNKPGKRKKIKNYQRRNSKEI